MALEIIQTDIITDNDTLNLQASMTVATAVVGDTTYLIVVGNGDSGLSVFAVDADGTLTNVDNLSDTDDLALNALGATTATIGDVTYVFVAGYTERAVNVFALEADGTLVYVAEATGLGHSFALTTATLGNTTYLLVGDDITDTVSSFRVAADGTLTYVDTTDLSINGPHGLDTAVVNGITYMFATAYWGSSQGVQVVEIAPDGTLSPGDTASVYGTRSTTAKINDTTYLFTGFEKAEVFSVAHDGTLSHVDTAETNGGKAFAVEVVDGVPYLFTLGDDARVIAFSVGGDGTLTEVAVAGDKHGYPTYEFKDLKTVFVGGVPYLISTAPDNGVSVFRLEHNIIDEAAMAVSVAENGTAVATIAKLYAEDNLIYSLGGVDAALFTIDLNGNLAFIAAPDFEAPGDADGDNVYEVTVTADDGIISETKALTVTVTDVNDIAPIITSDGGGDTAGVAVAESTTAVTTVVATDPEGTPTYAIVGGTDAALFDLDAITGALVFKSAPDFEAPADADTNNVYEVVVAASDGVQQDTQALSVAVNDVEGLALTGTRAAETLIGAGEGDTILGKKGRDTLEGLAGNDLLDGGRKKDKLTGGEDSDGFRFSSKLKNKWVDKITDFEIGVDMIYLDKAVFKKVGPIGALKEKYFDTGRVADSKNDHILFDGKVVRYDADGKGGADAVKVFKVTKGTGLSADDFMLV